MISRCGASSHSEAETAPNGVARRSGLLRGAFAVVRTPPGGFHLYFRGTEEKGGAAGHASALELKATGDYVLVRSSRVIDEKRGIDGCYELHDLRSAASALDWDRIRSLSEALRRVRSHAPATSRSVVALARWVEHQAAGNRNAGLYWAACHAAQYDQDLLPLVAAAVAAGLPRREAERTAPPH